MAYINLWFILPVRLLHSLRLVVIELSVGCETWPQWVGVTVWLNDPNMDCGDSSPAPNYGSADMHYGLTWPVGISYVLQRPLIVPLHSPNRQIACHQSCARRLVQRLFTSVLTPLYAHILINGSCSSHQTRTHQVVSAGVCTEPVDSTAT